MRAILLVVLDHAQEAGRERLRVGVEKVEAALSPRQLQRLDLRIDWPLALRLDAVGVEAVVDAELFEREAHGVGAQLERRRVLDHVLEVEPVKADDPHRAVVLLLGALVRLEPVVDLLVLFLEGGARLPRGRVLLALGEAKAGGVKHALHALVDVLVNVTQRHVKGLGG